MSIPCESLFCMNFFLKERYNIGNVGKSASTSMLNQFTSGNIIGFPGPPYGIIFSEKSEKFLAINYFFVNETKSRHPNKRLFHWHLEN